MNPIADVPHRIETLKGGLNRLRHGLAQGAPVDVAPLAGEIQALGRALAELPATEARPLRGALVDLFDELDRLGVEMTARRDALKAELEKLSTNRRAARAYGAGPGSGR